MTEKVNETIHWGIVETFGGDVRIDDLIEDAPLMTFHGPDKKKLATVVMRALALVYDDMAGVDDIRALRADLAC